MEGNSVKLRYYGGYCAQCNVWLRKSDNTLLYYPSPELMRAELNTDYDVPGIHLFREHLYEITEFGEEVVKNPAVGEAICPVITEQRNQERYRTSVLKNFREDRNL
jgi:hypothetical protein